MSPQSLQLPSFPNSPPVNVTLEEHEAMKRLIDKELRHQTEPCHLLIYGKTEGEVAFKTDDICTVERLSKRIVGNMWRDRNVEDRVRGEFEIMGGENVNVSSGGSITNLTGSITSSYPNNSKKPEIISIRLLYAPPENGPQGFHLDYSQKFSLVKTVLIALEPGDATNATEVIEWERGVGVSSEVKELALEHKNNNDSNDKESTNTDPFSFRTLKSQENGPALFKIKELSPVLLTKPYEYTILETSRHFHRRGPTYGSKLTRATLNIDVVERGSSKQFTCVDMERSAERGMLVCPQEEIDELEEQDLCIAGGCDDWKMML